MRLVIIGGSDAGISAGIRAFELDPYMDISVLLADAYPNYSICGLPFFLSGETPDWRMLAHRTDFPGIKLFPDHTATVIDTRSNCVVAANAQGEKHSFQYDRLVIATGARPVTSAIQGTELHGVFPLHTMDDSFSMDKYLREREPGSVVIVGAGYIGLEMADALTHRGLEVTLASRSETVLETLDPSLAILVEQELRDRHVSLYKGVKVDRVCQSGNGLRVMGTRGFDATADMVLIAVGVQPDSRLGVESGLATGIKGAIRVNLRMETTLPDIYAAGDCVETWHRLLQRNAYLPLGTTSHKQGRIAGENAAGGSAKFQGSLGTQVVKVFDLVIARTGLRESEALASGFEPLTVESTWNDHKAYYPKARKLHIRVTGDRTSGRLLGAQIVGQYGSEISKRIDVVAVALHHEMSVEQLSDLDLSYTPPLSSPWDPIQMAAQSWGQARKAATANFSVT